MPVPPNPSTANLALPCPIDEADEFIGRPAHDVTAAVDSVPGPIAVLGAGGKLGLHVSLMLNTALKALGRKDRVLAVSRFQTLRSRSDFDRLGITTAACDLEDPAALAALPEAATVFFLAGVKFGTSSTPGLLKRLNVEMPRLVAQRFCRSRIVAFSSGAVYPFVAPASGGATEQTPVSPVGLYAESCVEREQVFAEGSLKHGTRVVVIRLNYSVEFRYGVLVDVAQKVLQGETLDVTMGYLNMIWQNDAVDHSIRALALADSPAAPLNVTGASVHSVRDLAHRFGELFGKSPQITGKEADTAALNNSSRARKLFGEPRTSPDQMIRWVAAWLKEGHTTWGRPTAFEARNGQY